MKIAITVFVVLVAALYIVNQQNYNPRPLVAPFETEMMQPYYQEQLKGFDWQKGMIAMRAQVDKEIPVVTTDCRNYDLVENKVAENHKGFPTY